MHQFHKDNKSKTTVWQTMIKCCKNFCLQTSIHGFYHVAGPRRHWTERLIWVGITAVALWGAISVSTGQFQRYRDNPTVVALDKDYKSWRFSLPGVTACDEDRVSKEKLEKAIQSRWNVSPDDEKYEYYAKFVDIVANSDFFHLEGYEEFKSDPKLNVDLFKLVVEVMPDQHIVISSSEPISPTWTPIMTEHGACFVTNSIAVYDAAIVKPHPNTTKDMPFTCQYSMGLCFIMFVLNSNAHFFVHSPYDIADTSNPPSTIIPFLNRFTYLTVTETRAGQGVRELSPRRRACLYTDESSGNMTVYSTHMCRLGCRSRLAVKLCGCQPFYYFYEGGKPCTPAGMWCLSRYSRDLANFAGMKCKCSPLCLDSLFRESTTENKVWEKNLFHGAGAIRLTVYSPRLRYTREIVFHFEDLVVSFGGAAGLFLGASFISFVEIIYFLLERFCYTLATSKSDTIQEYNQKAIIQYYDKKTLHENRLQEIALTFKGRKHLKY
ncbi:unnamed protein product [Colias eurytheme]|nr:unnamed protein product [Colias eurytheme]